jgi:ferredoxin-NADP reductase
MLAFHRLGGYLFIALFCVMAYFMVARLRQRGADNSSTVTLHLALAMILSPLLFIKVLIARYYKNQHALLMPIGLTIFVLAFVLIASTTGPYLARASKFEQVSIDPANAPVTIDMNQASDLMQKRCSKCHTLDRVVGARKDAQGWLTTVNRMREMPSAAISQADAQAILSYLAYQSQMQSSGTNARIEVERALVDQRCGRCHNLDRVYKTVQTPEQWRETVARMVDYAAGSTGAIRPGEDQQIIDYLAATHTPEATNRKKAQPDAASSTAQSLVSRNPAPNPLLSTRGSKRDVRTTAFISVVCLAALALVIKRPRVRNTAAIKPAEPPKERALTAPRATSSSFVLQLVRIMQQTHDSKTLRFAVQGPNTLNALPGQFLTFVFLFDGKKETRCYSICSSPARSGYVEITPKRVNGGNVSVFLNERTSIGMTVEAAGPFGQFYLSPNDDKKIVLLAAGSGITPMMAMLRYIEDLSLDVQPTLLFCVRTREDIIFHHELEELQTRLDNFRYLVVLSQPDSGWLGPRGHISRELICEIVPETKSHVFFLCGPPPFMERARAILAGLGVEPAAIRQETFGGAGAAPTPPSTRTGFTIRFSRSGKATITRKGQTLLEAAAQAGVQIPSACRQGQCGTCKTRLVDGKVRMTAEQGLDPESQSRGYVLTCVGHAEGDVTLDA